MHHLKGNFLAIAAASIAAAVIVAGLAVNVASGAPTDTTPTTPTVVAGNPPAAPAQPPSTVPVTNPSGSQQGVGNAPGTGGQAGSSNLPSAGFGPDATGAGSLPMALVILGAAGFLMVSAGATFSRKRDS